MPPGRGLLPLPARVQERLDELRAYWEFASVCQFFHLFYSAYGWQSFNTDEFELDLIAEGFNPKIMDIVMKLLRVLVYYPRGLAPHNWEKHVKEQHLLHGVDDIFEEEDQGFFDLSLRKRLLVIFNLTEWQWDDPPKFKAYIKYDEEEDEDDFEQEWRVESIGTDSTGCYYWLFDDNRLYKETPAPENRKRAVSKKKGAAEEARKAREKELEEGPEPEKWELVCLTREDWVEFPKQFDDSMFTCDKNLAKFVVETVLPKVQKVLVNLEEERRRQEALMNARKSTRVQAKELHKTEILTLEQQRKQKEQEAKKKVEPQHQREESPKVEKPNLAELRAQRAAEREMRLQLQLIAEREAAEREEREAELKRQRDENMKDPAFRRKVMRQPGVLPPDGFDGGEDFWWFSCGCGAAGMNYDDGTEMIECDRCKVWQHTACLGVDSSKYQGKEFKCHPCKAIDRKPPGRKRKVPKPEDVGDVDFAGDGEVTDEGEALPRKRPKAASAPAKVPNPAKSAAKKSSPAKKPATAKPSNTPPAQRPAGPKQPPQPQPPRPQSSLPYGMYRPSTPGRKLPDAAAASLAGGPPPGMMPPYGHPQSAPPGVPFQYSPAMPPHMMRPMPGMPPNMPPGYPPMPPGMMPGQYPPLPPGYSYPVAGRFPPAWRYPSPQQQQLGLGGSPQPGQGGQASPLIGQPPRQVYPGQSQSFGSPTIPGMGSPDMNGGMYQRPPPPPPMNGYQYQPPQQYPPSAMPGGGGSKQPSPTNAAPPAALPHDMPPLRPHPPISLPPMDVKPMMASTMPPPMQFDPTKAGPPTQFVPPTARQSGDLDLAQLAAAAAAQEAPVPSPVSISAAPLSQILEHPATNGPAAPGVNGAPLAGLLNDAS